MSWGVRLAAVFLLLLAVVGLFADALAPYDPFALSSDSLKPPAAAHPLGTDSIGRDTLSALIHGIRPTLAVGLLAALIAAVVGVTVGAVSGYFGGWVDLVLMRITEFVQMFPVFFLAVTVVALTGPGQFKVILILGLAGWEGIARLVRVGFLSLNESEFVHAARSVGCSDLRLILRHILPNAIAPAVVAASFVIGRAILAEAGLSFLGLGDPSIVSWGQMLNNAQQFLRTAWWMAVFPGLAIGLTVVAANLAGDALNDFLNPRLRGMPASGRRRVTDTAAGEEPETKAPAGQAGGRLAPTPGSRAS